MVLTNVGDSVTLNTIKSKIGNSWKDTELYVFFFSYENILHNLFLVSLMLIFNLVQ